MNTKDEVLSYISQKSNNGALLLTGKWGCGKTYLISNIISELNTGNDYLAVSVSLFGINEIAQLHKKVKEEVFFSRGMDKVPGNVRKFGKKAKQVITPIANALKEYSKIAKGMNTVLSVSAQDFFFVEKKIRCFSNNDFVDKDLVLFFDDFERSKTDRIDLMGTINDYSENKGIKVIIIADEEHINENEYKEFKEKLVSRTIRIRSDYQSSIKSIVNSYEETSMGYRDFLQNNLDVIFQVFEESQTENLRLVKKYLMDYERVYAAWRGTEIPNDHEIDVFYMFGAMLFGAEVGIYEEGEYGFIFADTESRKIYSKWNGTHELFSVQNWIVKGEWDKKKFVDEIKNKYCLSEMSDAQKFLIYGFWDLQQSNIDKGMPDVVEMAYNGLLARDQIIELLKKIHVMKENNMPLPCDISYSKIQQGFDKRTAMIFSFDIEEPKRHTFLMKDQMDEEAFDLYNRLENFENKLVTLDTRKKIVDYLHDTSAISRYELQNNIVNCFDNYIAELFLDKYLREDNGEKRELALMLLNLDYSDTKYTNADERQETVQNFMKLKADILKDEQNDVDYMTSAINRNFAKHIEELIGKVKEVDLNK